MTQIADRFWSKVVLARAEECWLWTSKLNNRGYGMFFLAGKMVCAHRVAFILCQGGIPEGLEIDHLCGTRACQNPAHLEAVDHRTNLLRGSGVAAVNAAKTHCPQGHLYSPENTYNNPNPDGGRSCRICKRASDARYRAQRRTGVTPRP